MMAQIFKKQLWVLIFTLASTVTYAQTFEGWITYKIDALNPNPEMIPDSIWQQKMKETLGTQELFIQKYYYKKDKYTSEMNMGKEKSFLVYNPQDKLLYSWQMNTNEGVTIDSRKYADEFVEIINNKSVETILGIPCQSIIVKSKSGQLTLWYNNRYFKMDAGFYKGHIYGHWEQILNRIGCLPLKIEQKGFMTRIVQTAIAYKEEPVNDTRFAIPKFETVTANPAN